LPFHHVASAVNAILLEYSSLTLREEHRVRVFENKVLRRIFGRRRLGETA
jgi:hypothetical protein